MSIQTRYENNPGTTDNVSYGTDQIRTSQIDVNRRSIPVFQINNLPADVLENLEVDHVDILGDEVQPHHYKECEDLKYFKSEKTGRGPLKEGWRDQSDPIMCSYKTVHIKAEIWMLQSRLEEYAHKVNE